MKKTILITGVGGAAGVFLIKHLQKNNFKVIAVDSNPYSYGLLQADINIVVPDCTDENYLSTIQNICTQEDVSFILPLIDEELALVKSLESSNLKVICPTIEFINLCLDKFSLMKALSNIRVYIPKTFLLSENIPPPDYPLIIKPRTGRGSRNVHIVNDLNQLNEIKTTYKNQLNDFLVQKKIEGHEYTVSVVTDPENKFISVIPKKIIEKKGITKIAVTEKNSAITTICQTILEKLNPKNSFNVQLILNKTDNKPYIFEINPRYSTTVTLTIKSGVDEIMAALNFYIKNDVPINHEFQEGVIIVRSVREEFMDLSSYQNKTSHINNFTL